MVGNNMFNVQINNRRTDIKGSKNDFGGVSAIARGDLFQLQPVMDTYIYLKIYTIHNTAFLLQIYGNSISKCLSSMKL